MHAGNATDAQGPHRRQRPHRLPMRGPPRPQDLSPPSRRQTDLADPFAGFDDGQGWQEFDRPPPRRMRRPREEYVRSRQPTFGPGLPDSQDDLNEHDLSWDSELDAPTDSDEEHVKLYKTNPFLRGPPPPT
ncbi:hypothetical protein LTR53_019423, partial [Teratosphaeriaceae sp. CCFEE 6253]